MKEKTSPLQNLLARFGIGPKPAPAFKPYDRDIPNPADPSKTLTLHYDSPNTFTLDAEGVKSLENWPPRRSSRPPVAPTNG